MSPLQDASSGLELTGESASRKLESALATMKDNERAVFVMYELGRLRRNVLGDTAGALQGYRTYLQRFPAGAFRTEAAVSVVELLYASGGYLEALTESEQMLANGIARERAPELRLLRARTYHHRLGDCARAEVEYARLVTLLFRSTEKSRM